MEEVLPWVIIGGLGIYGLLVLLFSIQILSLKKIKVTRIEIDRRYKKQAALAEEMNTWAQANDFEFDGYYLVKVGLGNTFCGVWRRPDRPTFFSYVVMAQESNMKKIMDITTTFEDGVLRIRYKLGSG